MENKPETVENALASMRPPIPGGEAANHTLPQLREGSLVFCQAQRVIYSSSNLRSVLRLPERYPVASRSVTELVAFACGPEQESFRAMRSWLDQLRVQSTPVDTPPLVLQTANDARTLHVKFNPIGDEHWIASFEDVSTDEQSDDQTLAIASRDHLTGIGNRAFFEGRLDKTLACLAEGEVANTTLFFLDLDRFKVVNDTLGHATGDALLRLVSERLRQSLRDSDTLARLGGDEFAILLASASGKDSAASLATRIIDMVQRPYLIDGNVINIGASIGIAIAPEDGTSRDQLLKSADLALYQSKAAGRGVFHFFQPAMQEKAQRRRSLEMDLRKALVLRQFELHYQPQIDVETETVIGLEGLLRWRHPQRGLVLPGDFIPLAEELGLAIPIGEWVLKTACREAMRWPDSVTVAVNVSPLQFEMGKFASTVEKALSTAGLPGSRLEIEVTENILLRDSQTVLVTLMALRALGVRVVMDSFGTGVASLSQLVNFPFDKIKIDRSLIALQGGDAKNRAIVRAISALGHSLGISTLAEGVETAEHLAHVRSEGCQSVQGFYYSKAVPSSELAALITNLFPATESGNQQVKEMHEQRTF
jgi:diguanylate cyclase (GGDEF)-like protein